MGNNPIIDFFTFKNVKKNRKRQSIGIAVGIVCSLVVISVLAHPDNEEYLCKGRMNTGHENMQCFACHIDTKGSMRQQLQGKVQYYLGLRKTHVDFGKANVDDDKCLACHNRENDRHPIHRFNEPRFAKALQTIQAQKCESCHLEHSGMRVTVTQAGYCQSCHEDLDLKYDPIEIPHKQLIKDKKWTSCLQCHDFHGNHVRNTPLLMKDTLQWSQLKTYFEGGTDPYSVEKKYKALKTMYYEK